MRSTRTRRAALAGLLTAVPLGCLLVPTPSSAAAPLTVTAHVTGTASDLGWYDGPQQVVLEVAGPALDSGEWTMTSPMGEVSGPLGTGTNLVDVTAEGQTTVQWLVTTVDGEAVAGSTALKVDAGDPVIEVFSLADHTELAQGAQQPLVFRCTDAVTRAVTCLDGGGRPSGADVDTATRGAKTATVTAVDAAGNTSTRTVPYDVIAPDTTAPRVSGRVELGTKGDNGWWRGHVVFEMRASDPVVDHENRSGLHLLSTSIDGGSEFETDLPSTTHTLRDGRHAIAWWATDRAGNASVRRTASVNVDDTSPLIERVYPTYGQHLTTRSSATPKIPCTDATSGIAVCTTPQLDLTPGAHQVNTLARDRAGNIIGTSTQYVVDAPSTTTIAKTVLASTKPGVVTVTVTSEVPVYGYGAIYSGTTEIGTFSGSSVGGAALTKTFRVPVTSVPAGTRTITAKYLGWDGALPSAASVTVQVK